MGYAGYAPTKFPPAKPTEIEAALAAIKSLEALEIIGKLVYNAAVQPKEEKYRKIKLSNEKINTTIVQAENAVDALRAMGWMQEDSDLEFLTIPAGKYMTMREVRSIEDAKDRLKKAIKEQARL